VEEASEKPITRPPRVVPVAIDYRLFAQVLILTHNNRWNGNSPQWQLIALGPYPSPLNIDLQAITWEECKDNVLEHIASGHPNLKDYLNRASKQDKTSWFACIEGNDQYGGHNGDGIQILNHLQFIDFATRAYNAYPREITIRVVMAEPHNVSHQCTRPYL
jgi:hypothetical protein